MEQGNGGEVMLFKILAILFVFIPAFFFWVLLGFGIAELLKK
jgi:hypothetical protein